MIQDRPVTLLSGLPPHLISLVWMYFTSKKHGRVYDGLFCQQNLCGREVQPASKTGDNLISDHIWEMNFFAFVGSRATCQSSWHF
jgi:hypothetical protein